MRLIDSFLDRITMYRLMLYYLLAIVVIAFGLAVFNDLPFKPEAIVLSTGSLVLFCWAANRVLARAFRVPHNPESSLITGLILALILTPSARLSSLPFLALISILAMASKYLFNFRGSHIFNPAAFAVVVSAILLSHSASWWVSAEHLLPVVIVGGLLVVRKIQREAMVGLFFVVVLAGVAVAASMSGGDVAAVLQTTLTSSALFFIGFVMLPEPFTSPKMSLAQLGYAGIVGVLSVPQLHLGTLYSTPEVALLAGNAFAFAMNPRTTTFLRLVEKVKLGPSTYDFVFKPDRRFSYMPGQYIEMTLAHSKQDMRGARRYFTLASSPTEDTLHFGVRFYEPGSSFKKALLAADDKTPIVAGQLAGDFTLPKDTTRPVVLIAGGIGITPYRSMLQYLVDQKEKREVTLLYSERSVEDVAYKNVLSAARSHGINVVCTLTGETDPAPKGYHSGRIDKRLLKSYGGDLKQTLFYISGPHTFVNEQRRALLDLQVPIDHIKIDFFPGYV